MRFAARVFFRCISFCLIFALLLPLFSQVVSAQTLPSTTTDPDRLLYPKLNLMFPTMNIR